MPVRPRFDPSRPLVAARAFTFAGRPYAVGDPFPHPEDGPFADRLRARQYEARAVNMTEAAAQDEDPVQMTGPKGGRYEITAPWLERPLTIRGKVNAEKALAEMREEGPPLGFIDGGSDVEVEEVGGGWYEISAPWLDEPEKVQGREAVEARQRELHDAGEPATHHGVTLSEADTGNGYYDVKADWLAEAERVHGQDAARERAAELREEGPPEDWTPESGIAATPEGEQASDDQAGDAGSDDGAQAGETAQSDSEANDPTSEGPDENPSNAESEGAADEATDDAASTDGAEQAEGADSGAEATDAAPAEDQADDPAEADQIDESTESAADSEGEEQPADAAAEEAPVEKAKPAPRKRARTAKAAKAEAGASKDDSPADA